MPKPALCLPLQACISVAGVHLDWGGGGEGSHVEGFLYVLRPLPTSGTSAFGASGVTLCFDLGQTIKVLEKWEGDPVQKHRPPARLWGIGGGGRS